MTNLERRALLGDAEAQRECTEKGIVLPCPFCGFDERDMIGLTAYNWQHFYHCEACGCDGPIVYDDENCDYPSHEALAKWNTRAAPPIGRCGECDNWNKNDSCGNRNLGTFVCACQEWSDHENGMTRYTPENGFCGHFDLNEEGDNK